jgi:hypothetical protein
MGGLKHIDLSKLPIADVKCIKAGTHKFTHRGQQSSSRMSNHDQMQLNSVLETQLNRYCPIRCTEELKET